ncbi:MAG: hypothetical protein HQL23_07990 [Candidatus Omnitrophica bacterium]|nr:hypothetical protein [Candidatus Omnitrophota bacterium]
MSSNILENLQEKVSAVTRTQAELNEQLLLLERDLSQSLAEQDRFQARLKEFLDGRRVENREPAAAPAPLPVVPPPEIPPPVVLATDPTAQLEKLLQGLLDALGDKFSDRLMGLMPELKSLPVEMRGLRLHEIKQAADAELVDLSALYKYQEVQSNIDQVGVDEKETKGIDKNLEKLRKMRAMKNKT